MLKEAGGQSIFHRLPTAQLRPTSPAFAKLYEGLAASTMAVGTTRTPEALVRAAAAMCAEMGAASICTGAQEMLGPGAVSGTEARLGTAETWHAAPYLCRDGVRLVDGAQEGVTRDILVRF